MKERPIIFNSEMVRAILEGRKTQTRRPMKPQPVKSDGFWKFAGAGWSQDSGEVPCVTGHSLEASSPYGKPGDTLWVRETWAKTDNINSQDNWPGRPHKSLDSEGFQVVIYGADGSWRWCDGDGFSTERSHWKPSIHMPRWASRITLEITNVRVEMVQGISEEDAEAEGVCKLFDDRTLKQHPDIAAEYRDKEMPYRNYCWHGNHEVKTSIIDNWSHQYSDYSDAKGAFSSLWESIYGVGSWAANPWVWVYEFRRVE